jgi:hypothetical protein
MNIIHKLFLLAQDFYIKISSFVSPSIIHNSEKHNVLKKFLFYKEIESIPGDYLEFGVYEGTSLKGAAVYWRKISKKQMNFYGFDSFTGMKPEKDDEHAFYTNFDFSTDFNVIKGRFRGFPEVKLIPGFFQETLKKSPASYGIQKAAIVFIDCDLYSAAKCAFNFVKPVIQKGTIFILDDYFNYLGNAKKGIRAAFNEFAREKGLEFQELTKYGIGGIVFLISNIKK